LLQPRQLVHIIADPDWLQSHVIRREKTFEKLQMPEIVHSRKNEHA
jgi:hypothetical protein